MISRERSFAVAKRIPLETIDAAVCAQLGPARVAGNSQPAAFNRQVAMYLAKHVGGWTTTRIGKFYNGRDHSTVCHSIRRVEVMRDGDPELDALRSSMGNDLRNIEPRFRSMMSLAPAGTRPVRCSTSSLSTMSLAA
jgi:chromosomal replication initiation ATPase DnaA